MKQLCQTGSCHTTQASNKFEGFKALNSDPHNMAH